MPRAPPPPATRSYYWWMLVMQFVTLAGLLTMTALGLLGASAFSWMAWLTVLSLLFIQGSDTFLAVSRLGLSGRSYSFAALSAAGWIIIASACRVLGVARRAGVVAVRWRSAVGML
jgi:uncharacterized membrane protein YhaH (DUF805 family)